MIKALFTTLLMVISFTIFAQSQDTIPEVNPSLIYHDMKQALTMLSEPIQEGAKYGFEIITRYYFWKGISCIFLLTLLIGITVWLIRLTNKEFNKNIESESEPGFMLVASLCFSVILSVISLIMLGGIYDWITMIATPEYHAIKDILGK